MKFRLLGALAAAALAATALSACDSKVGTAAFVGDDRITESTVSGYLTPQAVPFTTSTGATIVPRSAVLQTLVQRKLFDRALQDHGGPATPSELAEGRAAILQGSTEQEQTAQLVKDGFKSDFVPVYLDTFSLEYVLAKRLNASSSAEILTAMQKLGVPVTVNGRYGAWDAKTLSLGKPPTPSFLTLPSATAAAAG